MISVWTFQLGHPMEQWSGGGWMCRQGAHERGQGYRQRHGSGEVTRKRVEWRRDPKAEPRGQ